MATSVELFPGPPKDVLAEIYLGKSIHNVSTPAAVINVAAVRRNCERMLQTCDSLGLSWRAHVKTHKTVEILRFQVGQDANRPVNIIVSTVAEAEFLLSTLKEYKSCGRKVNVLYGLPIAHNAVSRLAAVAQALGEASVSVLLDDPLQIPVASKLHSLSGVMPNTYIKVDMGGRRAGVPVQSNRFLELADAALEAHRQGSIILSGLYSHAGHSYGGDNPVEALRMMRNEITAVMEGARRIKSRAADKSITDLPDLVVSAGASPTSLAVQNLTTTTWERRPGSLAGDFAGEVHALTELFGAARQLGSVVEIHAGVYPTLDLQQLAAHSIDSSRLSWKDMALTILAEVHSTYPGRGANGTDEALIGAGGLALAREACKAYEGMAMVTPWNRTGVSTPTCGVEDFRGWIVGRLSQEHGILTWRSGGESNSAPLETDQQVPGVEQKVRLWPNHACITSSHYGWYLVVDEDNVGREDEIVDVWIRGRGW